MLGRKRAQAARYVSVRFDADARAFDMAALCCFFMYDSSCIAQADFCSRVTTLYV